MDIPVDYEICGSPREIQRQIGNAVPPGLAEAIVRGLIDQLNLDADAQEMPNEGVKKRADGGTSPYENGEEIQIGGSRSPWKYAEEVMAHLDQGQSITLRGRGKRIAQVIDVVELVRRRFTETPEIELEQSTSENPEGSKSDYLSVLRVNIES